MEHKALQKILDMNAINQNPSYSVEFNDEVYSVLTHEVRSKLQPFLATFNQYRLDNGLFNLAIHEFKNLPNIYHKDFQIWKARRSDLKLIQSLIGEQKNLNILDIGSWNGWLSNRLSEMKHQVIALDYFIHEMGGLKSKLHYPNDWLSLQMDIHDFKLIKMKFDFIIINRCIAYWPDPIKKLEQLISKLSTNGKILITGLNVVENEQHFALKMKKQKADYQKKYNHQLLFNDTKGYTSKSDGQEIEQIGFQLKTYPLNWPTKLKRAIKSANHLNYYGIYNLKR